MGEGGMGGEMMEGEWRKIYTSIKTLKINKNKEKNTIWQINK